MTEKEYWTPRHKGITITLTEIITFPDNTFAYGNKVGSGKIINIIPTLPDNLGNYFSWTGIQLKKHFKKTFRGRYIIQWFDEDKKLASLAVNCDTDKDLDACVFQ